MAVSLLRESLAQCYKKLENDNFTKILDANTRVVPVNRGLLL